MSDHRRETIQLKCPESKTIFVIETSTDKDFKYSSNDLRRYGFGSDIKDNYVFKHRYLIYIVNLFL